MLPSFKLLLVQASLAVLFNGLVVLWVMAEQTKHTSVQPIPPFSEEYDTVERRAVLRQMRRDLDRISLGTASRFHRRLIRTFERELPKDVEVAYSGPLRLDRSHPSMRILGQGFTGALEWDVQSSLVIFSFWISTARTDSTAATCEVNGMKLFLNVSHVNGNRLVNEPLDELGGKSVKEALRLLETPPPPEWPLPDDPGKADEKDTGEPSAKKREDFDRLIELIQSNQGEWQEVEDPDLSLKIK